MLNSILKKTLNAAPLLLFSVLIFSFKNTPDTQQMLSWSNRILPRIYDPSGEVKLKKWELSITDDFFLRLRKTYQNNKQEYYSCQLHSFADLDYIGSSNSGLLRISTQADHIIVQTYNDRKGDVDSMATTLTIPVKNMEPEQVDSLRSALLHFKNAVPAILH